MRAAVEALQYNALCLSPMRQRQGRTLSARQMEAIGPHEPHALHPTEVSTMLMTTTPNIEGKKIVRYCGVITGEAILGANIFKDMFAGIRDIVGGRSATYEKELQRARDIALAELRERASQVGANAVVGIDLDYEVLGQGNGMLMVSASGTAVVFE